MGFASVFWVVMPRIRGLCVVLGLPMLVALIGMDYHFVGDVIAGGTLGGSTRECLVEAGKWLPSQASIFRAAS